MLEKQYNPNVIEKKVQRHWQENQSFNVVEDDSKEKYYCLCMLPYPSGKLHIGHVRNYTIGDIVSRYQRMQGKNVLQPMGWDAFGLPAEGAAIKNKMAPAKWTYANIDYMKNQLDQLGFAYDWSREVTTCQPDYYKWEQWFFTRLYEKGLVYKKSAEVNWDPVDQTVLANEQVVEGRGWRSGAVIEKREMPQWFIKITDYAEELLVSLDDMDWPEMVKTMQRNWIGKSVGLELEFRVDGYDKPLEVFTTRPDTIFGATFMAVAYNHPLAKQQAENNPELAKFCQTLSKTSTAEADIETMEKQGMQTGLFATHPMTGAKIPVLVANFVLMSYGSGAVMAVPAHDQRDFEFAQKYNLPITPVIEAPEGYEYNAAYAEKGKLINSGEFNGLDFAEAFAKISKVLADKGIAKQKTNYRLRDWLVSRQRYWGAPIPFYETESGETIPVPLADLPVTLPEDVEFSASGSPIKSMPEFINATNSVTGEAVKRETDTFDTFMESSWYYARYACPGSDAAMLDERANYWLPVDLYIGGIEHAILHLLYARFYHKLLRDEGLVTSDEPFKKLLTQGMVVAETYYRNNSDGTKTYFNPDDVEITFNDKGQPASAILKEDNEAVEIGSSEKMSKSKNNGADPQKLIDQYGADTVRLFIAFAAPPEQSLEWSDSGVEGAYKFLRKLWAYASLYHEEIAAAVTAAVINPDNAALKKARFEAHSVLKQANFDFSRLQFNTVVSAAMKIFNSVSAIEGSDAESNAVRAELFSILLRLLAPITPHITHELWENLGFAEVFGALLEAAWPQEDKSALVQDEIEMVVQVNGKVRAKITMANGLTQEEVFAIAQTDENVQKFSDGKAVIKVILVPNKLLNIVVKG